jgi:hypothetical protein
MLYSRNTNQVQTIERARRGDAPERPWAAFSASYFATPTYTTGALFIINDQTTIATLTTSGSTFNTRISASNDVTINLSGSLTAAALTGSFTMSLSITSSDYSYDTTIYSAGQLTAFFQPLSASVYDITGSLRYDTSGSFSTCSYYFVKSGITSPQATTASYTACGTTSSAEMYFTTTLTTASLGCVLNNSVTWLPPLPPDPSGSLATQFAQIWRSPYGCDFTWSINPEEGNRSIRFEAPFNESLYPDQNWFLASWVPEGTTAYEFRIVPAGQTLTVCTRDRNSAFFSPDYDEPYNKQYIVDLGVC